MAFPHVLETSFSRHGLFWNANDLPQVKLKKDSDFGFSFCFAIAFFQRY